MPTGSSLGSDAGCGPSAILGESTSSHAVESSSAGSGRPSASGSETGWGKLSSRILDDLPSGEGLQPRTQVHSRRPPLLHHLKPYYPVRGDRGGGGLAHVFQRRGGDLRAPGCRGG